MALIGQGQEMLMRIIVGENDRWQGRSLVDVLVERFHREGFAGATVLKGSAGFGGHNVVHTDQLLRFSSDLPVVIEVVDKPDKIEGFLPLLDEMLTGGVVTLEEVAVRRYATQEGTENVE